MSEAMKEAKTWIMSEAVKEAKSRMKAASKEFYESGGVAAYCREELFNEWRNAETDYNLLIVNEAAATVEDPISRAELVGKLEVAINSKLNFGEPMVRCLEHEQVRGGKWDRYSVQAQDSVGGYRRMSQAAYERAIKVLVKYCPRRADNQRFATPYPLKKSQGNGFVAA